MSTRKTPPTKTTSTQKSNGAPRKPRGRRTTYRSKARVGKKAIVGYFSPELSKQIQILAIEEDTSMQAIIGEALDMLLVNRGKKAAGER